MAPGESVSERLPPCWSVSVLFQLPPQVPALERALEVVGERVGVAPGSPGALRCAVRRVGAVGVHRIDPVEVVGVDRESAVGESREVLAEYLGHQRRSDAHAAHRVAHDGVMGEEDVVAARPLQADGVRGDLVEDRRRDHGRALGDRDVVDVPAVGGHRGVGRDAEPHQNVVRRFIGREVESCALPAVRACRCCRRRARSRSCRRWSRSPRCPSRRPQTSSGG